MTNEIFGRTAEGEQVDRIAIRGGGLSACVIAWGAALQDLRLDGHKAPFVLGFDRFDNYPTDSPYFGAIVGRFANRIANGRFTIEGKDHQTEQNFLEKHTLHGGTGGLGRKVWTVQEIEDDTVTLACRAADGEMGFPGNLDVTCRYSLKPDGRLVIELGAVTDAPTLCSLAHHSYFNLDDGGATEALDHQIRIDADAYLPVDNEAIPTGHVVPVDDTDMDLREGRAIRNDKGVGHISFDHNFCLAPTRGSLRKAVWARGATSGIEMEVWTTEPGIQFYDGARVGRTIPGLDGIQYGAFAGFCLEPQIWPDAPNRSYFPQAVLRPEETYLQTTEYRFSRSS